MFRVANVLAQMFYKFFSGHTKQPAFKFKIMEKKITIEEWLRIVSVVLDQVAISVGNDGKVSFDEAVKLIILILTEIINAYNK